MPLTERTHTQCPTHGYVMMGVFCPTCGRALVEPIRCGECQRELGACDAFCRWCGTAKV